MNMRNEKERFCWSRKEKGRNVLGRGPMCERGRWGMREQRYQTGLLSVQIRVVWPHREPRFAVM
jgi:hypothetical protein